MEAVKQEVSKLLTRLPDDCSLEDVQYHLYVLQKIERGLKDAPPLIKIDPFVLMRHDPEDAQLIGWRS